MLKLKPDRRAVAPGCFIVAPLTVGFMNCADAGTTVSAC